MLILFQVLHLVGLALHEQRRAIRDGNHSFDFLSRALKGIIYSKTFNVCEA